MSGKNIKFNFDELRKGGILKQRQKDYFILRTRIPGGHLKTELLPAFWRIAKKYGKGYVHISTRQAIEVPWIGTKDIPALLKDLKKNKILKGACGPRSRNIVACPGSTVCRFGYLNTERMAKKLDKDFFGLDVPKKFKVSLSGCLNSCAKPQENDLGFIAQGVPEVDLSLCSGCGLCANVCAKVCARGKTEPAIIMQDKKPLYRSEFCLFEGDCIRVCPLDAWKTKQTGWATYVGGKIGRFPMLGYKIADFVSDKQVFEITRKAIALYNKISSIGERFGEAINRAGIEEVKKQLL